MNEFGARRRPIEPTPKQLNELFASQDHTKPILLIPPPKTEEELRRVDQHTANVISAADDLYLLLNGNKKHPLVFLIGGVGTAALAGEIRGTHSVFRTHKDVDFLVPEGMFPEYEADKIYSKKVPVGLGRIEEHIGVDIFIYRTHGNTATFSGGSYSGFSFDIFQVSRSDLISCRLYHYVLPIRKDILIKMKRLDAKTREKGRVDLERIKE